MAKEAIDIVRKAEEEAAKIIANAETDAGNLIKQTKEKSVKDIADFKTEIADELKSCINGALNKNSDDLEEYKKEVLSQCENRHAEILKNKDKIIGMIIDAVKKG